MDDTILLIFRVLFLEFFKKNIELKKVKRFYYIFLFLFIASPVIYLGVSISDETKRTDYPGKEISRLVQNKWDDNFINEIKLVIGDEWYAGNLSYHLNSRPAWLNDLKENKKITDEIGIIYTGNPKILKSMSRSFWNNKTGRLLYDWKKMKNIIILIPSI